MSRISKSMARLLAGLLLAAPLFTAHAVDQATSPTSTRHHKSHKKAAPLVLPPLPSGPLRQLPMDQIPAAAPSVTYQDGLLTIAAQNATLGEILREVRRLTGASIDVPPAGAGERVVVQLGPGAPRDVLAALLNGTSFNYVMLGSTSDPTALATVLLTPRSSSGEVQTAAPAPVFEAAQQPTVLSGRVPVQPQAFRLPMPGSQPAPGGAAAADADDSDDSEADDKDDDSDQAQPAQPGQAAVQPDVTPIVTQPDPQGTDPNQPNAGPKTPEQLLQMMRRGQPPDGNGPPFQPPQQPPQQ